MLMNGHVTLVTNLIGRLARRCRRIRLQWLLRPPHPCSGIDDARSDATPMQRLLDALWNGKDYPDALPSGASDLPLLVALADVALREVVMTRIFNCEGVTVTRQLFRIAAATRRVSSCGSG